MKAEWEVVEVEASKARDRDMRVANDVLKGVHAVAAEERSLMIDAVASRLDSLYMRLLQMSINLEKNKFKRIV